ncbi:MAG: ATP-binding protein [Spirochaetales bacterium]|nr:ATP-binding protein [Spirochaetales bacterium]
MAIKDPTSDGYIELKFGPRWKYIACARSFIQNFLAISINDQAKADKIAMAASELLENAVKYANGEETQISVKVSPSTEKIAVRVSNLASEESIKTLKLIYDKVCEGNPLDAYVAQMKEAALRNDGKSQLGLARIRYETGGDLNLEIIDKRVSVLIDIG